MRASLAFCIQLASTVTAIPWFGPRRTPPAAAVPQVPIFTNPPEPRDQRDLSKRDAAAVICGWIEGFSQSPYACVGTSTCFWNTEYHVIGCGVPSSLTFQTTCVGYYDQSASCDLSCSFNPSINRCPSTLPYCVNITLSGADVPYTAFACGSSIYTSYPAVQLTYSGESTPNYLPRFLGSNGAVSYGTQIPSGYIVASATTSLTISSTPSSASPSQTPVPLPATSPAQTPTPSSSSSDLGAIIGGAAGGGAGLAIIVGAVIYFCLRSKRKAREAGLTQTAAIVAEADNKNSEPQQSPYQSPEKYPLPQPDTPGYSPQEGYPRQAHPPQEQSYPQQQQHQQQQQQESYLPQQQAYQPQEQIYPQQEQTSPSQEQAYSPQERALPPHGQTYPPHYIPQELVNPPQQVYPSQEEAYAPHELAYPIQELANPPSGQAYPPQGQTYPPHELAYPPQELANPPQQSYSLQQAYQPQQGYPQQQQEYPPPQGYPQPDPRYPQQEGNMPLQPVGELLASQSHPHELQGPQQ